MAQVVKLKRSSTAGNVPTSGQMVAGELAMNTGDGKLYLRDDSDVRPIVTVDNEVTGSLNLTGDITSSDVYIDDWGSISASLASAGGGGNVNNTGTPADSQIAVFTDATTIEGTSGLTYDGTTLDIDGANAGSGVRIYGGSISVANPYISPMGFHSTLNFGDSSTGNILSMQNNKISFDGDPSNTYIIADTDTPENLEIHADGNIELRADDTLEIYSNVSTSFSITGSDVYIDDWGSVSASLASAGNVNNTGTPGNNQVAVWIDDTTIEGNSNLTWDGFTLEVDGSTGIRASSISNRHNDGRLGINAAGEWGYGADIWHHGVISSVTAGKVYYLNSSDGWTVAASGSLTAATGFLGVAPSTGNTSGGLVIRGFVYMNNNPGGSTGDKIYLADNGLITTTLPSTSTHFVRILGYKTAQTGVIYFNPSNDYIQLT